MKNTDPFAELKRLLKKASQRDLVLSMLLDTKKGCIKKPYTSDLNRAWYVIGDILYIRGDYTGALSAFKKSYQRRKEDVDAIKDIGVCYSLVGNPKMAKFYLEKARSIGGIKYKKKDRINLNLGSVYLDMFKYTHAITEYKKVRKSDKRAYKYAQNGIKYAKNCALNDKWFDIGIDLYNKSDYTGALSAYKKSCQYWKEDFLAYEQIGLCYTEIGNHKMAQFYLIKARKIAGKTYENWDRITYNLGNTYYDMGKYALAISEYKKLKKSDKTEYVRAQRNMKRARNYELNDTWRSFGYELYKQGAYTGARSAYKKAYRYWNKDVWVLSEVGNCYSKLGNPKMAKYYYIKARVLGGKTHKLWNTLTYNLGNEYLTMDMFTLAISEYKKVKESVSDKVVYRWAQENMVLAKEYLKNKKDCAKQK